MLEIPYEKIRVMHLLVFSDCLKPIAKLKQLIVRFVKDSDRNSLVQNWNDILTETNANAYLAKDKTKGKIIMAYMSK